MCDRCDKGPQEFMKDLLETIDTCGHAIIYVTDPIPGYEVMASYTVGLTASKDHGYELAQSGLSPHQSHHMLNDVPEAIKERGIKPVDGLIIEGVLGGGYNIKLRLAERKDLCNMAREVYGEYPTVWQILWPDQNNRFPGELGYALPEGALQELL